MISYVIRVSGSPEWKNNTTVITLKQDLRYVFRGAMGIWDIERGSSDIGFGGANTQGARWFQDAHEMTISLKVGWLDGDTSIKQVFELFEVNTLSVGNWGHGNFYHGKKTTTNIKWEVIKVLPTTGSIPAPYK
ncbi:hypothetical protein BH20ACI1_BH20ACI1_04100 [soil metagenome]